MKIYYHFCPFIYKHSKSRYILKLETFRFQISGLVHLYHENSLSYEGLYLECCLSLIFTKNHIVRVTFHFRYHICSIFLLKKIYKLKCTLRNNCLCKSMNYVPLKIKIVTCVPSSALIVVTWWSKIYSRNLICQFLTKVISATSVLATSNISQNLKYWKK